MNSFYQIRSPYFDPIACHLPDVAHLLALCFETVVVEEYQAVAVYYKEES